MYYYYIVKRKIFDLSQNVYVQGSIILTIASFIANLLNYIFHFITGRILGPVGYGDITTFYSYSIIFSVPIGVMSSYIIQKVGSKQDNQLVYAKKIDNEFQILIRKYFWVALLTLFLSPLLSSFTHLPPLISFLIIPMTLVALISTFYNSLIQGLKMFVFFAILQILFPFIKVMTITVGLFIKISSSLVIFWQSIFIVIILVGTIKIFNRKIASIQIHSSKFTPSVLKIIKDQYLQMTLISIVGLTLLGNLDIIFVKRYFSAQQSGIYNSWNLFAKMILYLVGPTIPVTFVYFSQDKNRYRYKALLLLIGLFGLFFIVSYLGYKYFSNVFVDILFGNKFTAITPYLDQAAIFGSLFCLITLFNNYYLAKKSRLSLIILFFIPIYLFLLYNNQGAITNIFQANIIFSSLLVFIYLIGLVWSLKSRPTT